MRAVGSYQWRWRCGEEVGVSARHIQIGGHTQNTHTEREREGGSQYQSAPSSIQRARGGYDTLVKRETVGRDFDGCEISLDVIATQYEWFVLVESTETRLLGEWFLVGTDPFGGLVARTLGAHATDRLHHGEARGTRGRRARYRYYDPGCTADYTTTTTATASE